MKKLLVRWLISALALFVAVWLVRGIRVSGTAWIAYALTAVVLGFLNASVRPILKFLTCPLILLTLGLFTLVINGIVLWLAAGISTWLGSVLRLGAGFQFQVNGFWPAFWGALVVSIVTVILSALVKEED